MTMSVLSRVGSVSDIAEIVSSPCELLRVPSLTGVGRCCLRRHILRPLSRHSVVRAVVSPAWRGLLQAPPPRKPHHA